MPTLSNIGPVLITGAGGFIGAHAVRDLAEAGAEVVATTRDGRRGTRVLDVCDADRLPAALAGVGAVVHCAVGGREVTVDGTAGFQVLVDAFVGVLHHLARVLGDQLSEAALPVDRIK